MLVAFALNNYIFVSLLKSLFSEIAVEVSALIVTTNVSSAAFTINTVAFILLNYFCSFPEFDGIRSC